jgi:DNA-binding transcriptional regulator YhcF (GntR family)
MLYLIKINEYSSTPKYKQIVNSIVAGIENQSIRYNDKLPSINEVSVVYDVSRDTVEKAYRELKERKLIKSVPGKGFYINDDSYRQKRKIFLLFNKLSAHKKIIYDTFVETLGDQAAIDFFVYHNNFRIFQNLLLDNDGSYTHYVIISHFFTGEEKSKDIINQLPKHKLLLLDKKIDGITGEYAAVYQNFEKDIYGAMSEAKPLLAKYPVLKIIFPPHTYHAKEILKGFQRYCIESGCHGKIVPDIEKEKVASGEAYITLMEDDLVILIKKVKREGLKVGRDIGILSYNENPLKEILLDGITVMSTDFQKMGETAAQMILDDERRHVENPFHLIIRNSL